MTKRCFLLFVIIIGSCAEANGNIIADKLGQYEYFRPSQVLNPSARSKCNADVFGNPYKYPTQSIWYRQQADEDNSNLNEIRRKVPQLQRRHNSNPMLDPIHGLFNFRYDFWDRRRSYIENKFPVCRRRPKH
ncbi:hypothetical protein WDU94_010685 [Cyamophila willieti]